MAGGGGRGGKTEELSSGCIELIVLMAHQVEAGNCILP